MLPHHELNEILGEAAHLYSRSIALGIKCSDARWPDADDSDFHEFNISHHLAVALDHRGWGSLLEYRHSGKAFDLVSARANHLLVVEAKTLYYPNPGKCTETCNDIKRLDKIRDPGEIFDKFKVEDPEGFDCTRMVIGSIWVPMDISLVNKSSYRHRIKFLNWLAGGDRPRDTEGAEDLLDCLEEKARLGMNFAFPSNFCADAKQGWFVQWLAGVAW